MGVEKANINQNTTQMKVNFQSSYILQEGGICAMRAYNELDMVKEVIEGPRSEESRICYSKNRKEDYTRQREQHVQTLFFFFVKGVYFENEKLKEG